MKAIHKKAILLVAQTLDRCADDMQNELDEKSDKYQESEKGEIDIQQIDAIYMAVDDVKACISDYQF